MDFHDWMNKNKISLEEYVRMRRDTPSIDRSIDLSIGPDDLPQLAKEASQYGVDSDALMDALGRYEEHPEDSEIEEVALGLLEAIVDREAAQEKIAGRSVERTNSIPDSLLFLITARLVEASSVPIALSILVSSVLGIIEGHKPRSSSKQPEARQLAAILLAGDQSLSNRAVADAVGVSNSTISRWKSDQNFQKEVSAFGNIQNIEPLLRRLRKGTKP